MATLSWQCLSKSMRKVSVGVVVFLWSFWSMQSAAAISLAQVPLFMGNSAKPTLMLAMSRDQELFYTAYPDYSNLDGGLLSMADTTYRNDFKYYGYFNSNWCYDYVADTTTKNSYFNPSVAAIDHKCSSKWSGNFLNWSTMTRIDVLRKVLFGGKRSVDTAKSTSLPAQTILERSFIPKDSHAFSKVFVGSSEKGNVSDYTPYSKASITLCNVSTESSDTNGYPLVRVAEGEWAEWSHTEKTECQWSENVSGRITSPSSTKQLAEAVAKVNVCVSGKDVTGNTFNPSDKDQSGGCYSYEESSYKPIGVLQKKYKDINFGLVMGTWAKSDQGGVLRKTAGKLAGNTVPSSTTDTINEFSEATGVFNSSVTYGIIKDINLLKIVGYPYTTAATDVGYNNSTDWRNPIAEIYAEALRYIIGRRQGTAEFDATDEWTIPGLTRIAANAWDDPVPAASWCSQCSILLISSGPNSFDNDTFTANGGSFLGTISSNPSLTKSILDDKTDSIGFNEFGSVLNTLNLGGKDATKQCAATSVAFSGLLGICPEAPLSEGSYAVAGLAYWAHTTDLRPTYTGTQTVGTYAVELSEGLPKFNIPLVNNIVNIVPVCMNGYVGTTSQTACSLVGARVENVKYDIEDIKDIKYSTRKPVSGSYLFYWEDQRWASDYDMDAVQRIEFCIGTACVPSIPDGQMRITNTLPYWATGTSGMTMGYNISGAVNQAGEDGLQKTLYVQRNGGDAHLLKDASGKLIETIADPGWTYKWYNTLPPAGKDALPANYQTRIYKTIGLFTPATTNGAKKIETPLFYAAKYGNFKDGNGNGIPDDATETTVSEWDRTNLAGSASSDKLPDNYFMMKNPALLESALLTMISEVGKTTASGSGVSTNSTQQQEGIFIYQASFNSEDWSGEVKSLSYASTSDKDYSTKWSTRGKVTSPSIRKIFSYNPDTKKGFEFKDTAYATMTATQQSALGSNATTAKEIINWTRGTAVAGYRKRTELFGDIVNSTPVYAGPASLGYDKLHADYNSASYNDFVKQKKDRKNAIYVGSNDGMLHAIDADNGTELFAYVPSMVYSNLKNIAAPAYASSHKYSVDGPVAVGDAYVKGKWRTILVGTLGAGGRGIFVLDVTDPASFNANDNVLFEIDEKTLGSIGNVMGKPYIAPVNGKWQIVLANGYNSTADKAELIVINLDDTTTKTITANNTTANGLSAVTLLQNPSTGAVESAYGGDLQGNMWKFNLAGSSSTWGVANSGVPLFIAKDSATPVANRQPIVSAPTLGRNAKRSNAVMVYFGTGKYVESDDITTIQKLRVQSFYGIADEGSSVTYSSSRDDVLHKKIMTVNAAKTLRDVDDSGETTIDTDWTKYKGWYLDFPPGERIVSKSLLLYDRLIFSTLIPKDSDCSFGGSGWLMELVGVGDVFGTKHELLPNNGQILDFFLPGELIVVKGGKELQKCNIAGGCSDEELDIPPLDAEGGGRMSWRQIR